MMDDWTIPPALLPNLTDLDLSHNRSVTDEELARCSSLRTLDLNCHFPPMTGTYFANMPELRVLRTWGQAGTGIHLSKLTKLEVRAPSCYHLRPLLPLLAGALRLWKRLGHSR